jgi:hypothetical protein
MGVATVQSPRPGVVKVFSGSVATAIQSAGPDEPCGCGGGQGCASENECDYCDGWTPLTWEVTLADLVACQYFKVQWVNDEVEPPTTMWWNLDFSAMPEVNGTYCLTQCAGNFCRWEYAGETFDVPYWYGEPDDPDFTGDPTGTATGQIVLMIEVNAEVNGITLHVFLHITGGADSNYLLFYDTDGSCPTGADMTVPPGDDSCLVTIHTGYGNLDDYFEIIDGCEGEDQYGIPGAGDEGTATIRPCCGD